MKSMALKHFVPLLAAVLASTIALAGAASAQSEESAAPSLQGTWRVNVTVYNCTTGVPRPSFWSLLSFQRGGTESETTSSPAYQPGQRTPGFGFWEPARKSAFCSSDPTADYFNATEAFIVSNSPTNPPGFKIGAQKILQCITMTGDDSWDANALVKFFNNDGTSSTLCATAKGTRLTGNASQP
jgi:hypothetical protein